MPRRMQFSSKADRPKDFDLLLPGLRTGSGRSKDRFKCSSETRDAKVYAERKAMIRDLANRLLWPLLRARLEGRFTTTDLHRAYREGDAALTGLLERNRGMLLAPLRDQFIKESAARGKDKYRRQIGRFIDAIGGDDAATTDRFNTTEIATFLADLKDDRRGDGSGASDTTRNRYRAALGGFATWLVRNGHIAVHPIADKRVPKRQESEGRLPEFSGQDYADYFCHAANDDPATVLLLKLLINTGADVGELFAARVSDCQLERRPARLRFKRSKTNTPERHVPIAAALRAELVGHIAAHNLRGDDLLFAMVERKQLVAVHRRLRATIHKGLVTLKDLRHVAAITWRRAGIDLQTIQEWLGHATLNQTARYAKYRPDDEEDEKTIERVYARQTRLVDVLPIRAAS